MKICVYTVQKIKAAPQLSANIFKKLDSDNSKSVSKEEFQNAFIHIVDTEFNIRPALKKMLAELNQVVTKQLKADGIELAHVDL